MAKMSKYEKLKDGDPIDFSWRKGEAIQFSCCDCGLVHQLNVAATRERVRIRFYRLDKETEKRREEQGLLFEPAGPIGAELN